MRVWDGTSLRVSSSVLNVRIKTFVSDVAYAMIWCRLMLKARQAAPGLVQIVP